VTIVTLKTGPIKVMRSLKAAVYYKNNNNNKTLGNQKISAYLAMFYVFFVEHEKNNKLKNCENKLKIN